MKSIKNIGHKGNCEDCAREENCRKDIGIIWGFCNTDFVPKGEEKKDAVPIQETLHLG